MFVHHTFAVFNFVVTTVKQNVLTMPLENLEDDGLEKNPNLELAQTKFLLSLPENKNRKDLKTKLLDAIKAESEFADFSLQCLFLSLNTQD